MACDAALQAVPQPRRERRGVPALRVLVAPVRHVRAVRRVGRERLGEDLARTRSRSSSRREPQRQVQRRELARSTLPARSQGGRPSAPVISSIGFHVWLMSCCAGSSVTGRAPVEERHVLGEAVVRAPPRCPSVRSMRPGGMSACRSSSRISPGVLVLDPRQDLAGDAERRRDDAAGVTRVHALGRDGHVELAGQQAAQRGGDPQVVVVGAAGVETDHQARACRCAPSALRCGPGRSRLPLSSLASMSTTQRACGNPAACAASMATSEANVE